MFESARIEKLELPSSSLTRKVIVFVSLIYFDSGLTIQVLILQCIYKSYPVILLYIIDTELKLNTILRVVEGNSRCAKCTIDTKFYVLKLVDTNVPKNMY